MEYKLSAKLRKEKGPKVRQAGLLPAVVYGAGKENESLSLVYNDFIKLYNEAGTSSLIDLEIDGNDQGKVLVYDIQLDPLTNNISHVDLRRIEMGKEMTAAVELNYINEAPAVKEHGGTLVKNLEEVEVRCLPAKLVSELTVDLSVLKTFEVAIRVKDLVVPEGITIINPSPEDMVAKAIPALTEEQLKAMEEVGSDLNKVEVAGEKEKEEAAKAKEEAEKK